MRQGRSPWAIACPPPLLPPTQPSKNNETDRRVVRVDHGEDSDERPGHRARFLGRDAVAQPRRRVLGGLAVQVGGASPKADNATGAQGWLAIPVVKA
jgi:hypothetical protein